MHDRYKGTKKIKISGRRPAFLAEWQTDSGRSHETHWYNVKNV